MPAAQKQTRLADDRRTSRDIDKSRDNSRAWPRGGAEHLSVRLSEMRTDFGKVFAALS
jgi:hypothetical protein